MQDCKPWYNFWYIPTWLISTDYYFLIASCMNCMVLSLQKSNEKKFDFKVELQADLDLFWDCMLGVVSFPRRRHCIHSQHYSQISINTISLGSVYKVFDCAYMPNATQYSVQLYTHMGLNFRHDGKSFCV